MLHPATNIEDFVEGEAPEGLLIYPEVLSGAEQDALMKRFVASQWEGFRMHKTVDFMNQTFRDGVMGQVFPEWVTKLTERIGSFVDHNTLPVLKRKINYVLNIRYQPEDGIHSHIDPEDFGEVIYCLNIGSPVVMDLYEELRGQYVRVLLRPGDAYVLRGSVRYHWEHGIPATSAHSFKGRPIQRTGDRVSLNFRANC